MTTTKYFARISKMMTLQSPDTNSERVGLRLVLQVQLQVSTKS